MGRDPVLNLPDRVLRRFRDIAAAGAHPGVSYRDNLCDEVGCTALPHLDIRLKPINLHCNHYRRALDTALGLQYFESQLDPVTSAEWIAIYI